MCKMPPSDSSKIIGLGLGRTGTTSLAEALRMLGYKTAHWAEVYASMRYDLSLPEAFLHLWDAYLDGPLPLMYEELWKPEHKFILTMRDVNDWYQSMVRHRKTAGSTRLKRKLRKAIFCVDDMHEPSLKYAFLRHEIHVKQFFRDKDNLLVMDIPAGDGWEKLCPFLGKRIPDKSFPHLNRSKKEQE